MEKVKFKHFNNKNSNNLDILTFTLFQILLFTLSIKISNNYISFLILFYFYFACFTGWHECVHKSNGKGHFSLIGILGVINMVPLLFLNYRKKAKLHIDHHVYTNIPSKDPDYKINNLILNSNTQNTSKNYGFKKLDFLEISLKIAFVSLIYKFWFLDKNILIFVSAYFLGNLFTHFIVNFYPHFRSKNDLGRDLSKNKLLSLTLFSNNLHGSHHKFPNKPWWFLLFIAT